MPAPERTRRRTQAERRSTTESALLGAAADVIAELGVAAVTMARVGERAGYSRGIVTHHYGSKQALLEAVARNAQSGVAAALETEAPGLDRLLRLIDEYLAPMTGRSRRWSAFVLLWAQAAANGELRQIMHERDDYFREQVHRDVVTAMAAGTIVAGTDPQAVAVALTGQLRGIGLQLLLDPAAVDLDQLRYQVPAHWRRALSAGPAGGPPPRPDDGVPSLDAALAGLEPVDDLAHGTAGHSSS